MAKKPLTKILHDQTIVVIDTSHVHGFEQECSDAVIASPRQSSTPLTGSATAFTIQTTTAAHKNLLSLSEIIS